MLEIGSGTGLAGLVAGISGAKSVIMSDYKEEVMVLIAKNITLLRENNSSIDST